MDHVVWATDASYYRYTELSIASFLRHNRGWALNALDVGLTADQRERLSKVAAVRPAVRENQRAGSYIPSAKARIEVLTTIAADDILLYLDGDTIVTSSVDGLRDRFAASGRALGIISRADRVGWGIWPMHRCWLDQAMPRKWFAKYDSWKNEPTRSTGVIIANSRIVPAATRSLGLYEDLKSSFALAEQTLLNSVLMEDGVATHDLSPQEHCLVEERLLVHHGEPYSDAPLLDGLPVIIRHFPGPHKQTLNAMFPRLRQIYRLSSDMDTAERRRM